MNESNIKARDMARMLIGSIISRESAESMMGVGFHPQSLQGVSRDESEALSRLLEAYETGVGLTRDNAMALLDGVIDEPISYIDQCVEMAAESVTPGAYAFQLSKAIEDMLAKRSASAIGQILTDPAMRYEDKWLEALEILQKAKPQDSKEVEFLSATEQINKFTRIQKKIYEDRKSGKTPGFGFPLPAHKLFFSRMASAETTLVMGMTGTGKTVTGDLIAEYNAWALGNCDVVHISTETSIEVLLRRMYSRRLKVPWRVMDAGVIDMENHDVVGPLYKKLNSKILEMTENRGHIYRYFNSELTIDEAAVLMRNCAKISRAAGRKILFIIDVLQELELLTDRRMDERQAMEYAMSRFHKTVASIGTHMECHGVMIAHQRLGGEDQVFGSSMVKNKNQLAFAVRREIIEGGVAQDVPMKSKGGETQKDTLNNNMYWCRKGQTMSHEFNIEIVKANNAPSGILKGYFSGEYAMLVGDPEQEKEAKNA